MTDPSRDIQDALEEVCERVITSASLVDYNNPHVFIISPADFKQTCEGLLAVATALAIVDGSIEVPPYVQAELVRIVNQIVEAREILCEKGL
jgi:hypothetical protein